MVGLESPATAGSYRTRGRVRRIGDLDMPKTLKSVAVTLVFALLGANAWGQGIFATLTGVVSDPSQSVIAGAKISLRDMASGSTRDTVTNGDGYYPFASV